MLARKRRRQTDGSVELGLVDGNPLAQTELNEWLILDVALLEMCFFGATRAVALG